MKSFRFVSVASVVAIVASVLSVEAADMIPEPPIVELPPVEKFGGWYLRGDVGYAMMETSGISYFQGASMTGSFDTHEIDHSWTFGGGVGYQVNDWFRVDWTGTYYWEADFSGSSALGVACSDGTVGAVCDYHEAGSFSATTILANAYFDLGNYHGFTPYVGGGIGGAYVEWGSMSNDESHSSGATPAVLVSDTHAGASGWRFAYGLHAGASYDITSKMKVDAGYSYVNISEGAMFGFGATSGLVGDQGYHGDIDIHAFKLGLRYQIW